MQIFTIENQAVRSFLGLIWVKSILLPHFLYPIFMRLTHGNYLNFTLYGNCGTGDFGRGFIL